MRNALRTLSGFALLLALSGCTAAGLATVNLIARFGSYQRVADIPYGESAAQALDVYVPAGAAFAPIVVFFHGGRWSRGAKEQYRFVGQALASRGMVAVVADYRRFPEVRFPGFVDDAARAVAWAHGNAERYGGDADALFVMGHSSGAHMAALLALDHRYLERAGADASWLRGMIGLAGPYDFDPRREAPDVFATTPDADLYTTQPIAFAQDVQVPLLLVHGEADETVQMKNTLSLTAAVRRAGGTACAALYPGVDHAGIVAALARPLRATAPVLDDVARFVAGVRASGAPRDPGCS